MVIAQLNARLRPMDRGEYFEDPLDAAMKKMGHGEVTGAGSMLASTGEIAYRQIEVLVPEASEEILQFMAATLEDLGAPKGSTLTVEESGAVRPLGKVEGLAVYLNGTDLPDETYKSCDVDFVFSEFARLLGTEGRVLSFWRGSTETASYMYGASFAGMRARLEDFLATYPLCQKCRIVQIA